MSCTHSISRHAGTIHLVAECKLAVFWHWLFKKVDVCFLIVKEFWWGSNAPGLVHVTSSSMNIEGGLKKNCVTWPRFPLMHRSCQILMKCGTIINSIICWREIARFIYKLAWFALEIYFSELEVGSFSGTTGVCLSSNCSKSKNRVHKFRVHSSEITWIP